MNYKIRLFVILLLIIWRFIYLYFLFKNISFLDTDYPQLVFLKNKLWSEIFNLISTLLENSADTETETCRTVEAASILSTVIFDTGSSSFLESLSESLSCLGSKGIFLKSKFNFFIFYLFIYFFPDLQLSSLTALTCLSKTEICRIYRESPVNDVYSGRYFKDLLDFSRSPKCVIITDSKENIKPGKFKKNENKRQTERYK